MTDTARTSRLGGFRARVRALPGGRIVWRVCVTLLGIAVIAIGIVLLPLPGPGWVIIFAGLGLLATEYEWARRLLTWGKERLKAWTAWLRRQPLWVRVLGGVLSLVLLAGLVIAGLLVGAAI